MYLPSRRKTNGQLWVHWQQVYRWLHPYLNVALSASSVDTLLPYPDEIESKLTSALLTAKVSYTGMTLTHTGPMPLGIVTVPGMVMTATGTDESGGSDLSRERLACRHLRVLYHHAKLFKKDHGRWPAEVAELDGYVDFAGHPDLLKLKLSSKQKWGDWFKAMTGTEAQEEETDDPDDPLADIDDKLYVIDWGENSWRLGFAPGSLVHLESLYIDQDGVIHRTPVKESPKDSGDEQPRAEAHEKDTGDIVGDIMEHASNLEKRYHLPDSPKKK